jgi:hypothetical protein
LTLQNLLLQSSATLQRRPTQPDNRIIILQQIAHYEAHKYRNHVLLDRIKNMDWQQTRQYATPPQLSREYSIF